MKVETLFVYDETHIIGGAGEVLTSKGQKRERKRCLPFLVFS
jgi:hypothetical protein